MQIMDWWMKTEWWIKTAHSLGEGVMTCWCVCVHVCVYACVRACVRVLIPRCRLLFKPLPGGWPHLLQHCSSGLTEVTWPGPGRTFCCSYSTVAFKNKQKTNRNISSFALWLHVIKPWQHDNVNYWKFFEILAKTNKPKKKDTESKIIAVWSEHQKANSHSTVWTTLSCWSNSCPTSVKLTYNHFFPHSLLSPIQHTRSTTFAGFANLLVTASAGSFAEDLQHSLRWVRVKPQWVDVWEDKIVLTQRHANSIKLNHLLCQNERMSMKFPCKWEKIYVTGSTAGESSFIILKAVTYLLLMNSGGFTAFISSYFKYALNRISPYMLWTINVKTFFCFHELTSYIF